MPTPAQRHYLILVAILHMAPPTNVSAQERWDLGERQTAGHFGGDVEFGAVSAVTLGPLGIYAGDGMNSRVVVLDSLLRPVLRLGREGSGPAEFRSVSELTVRGDTIYAYDGRLRRLTAMSTAGDVAWTESRIPRILDEGADPHPAAVLADGALLVRGRASPPSLAHGLHRFDRFTRQRRRIATLDYSDDMPMARMDVRGFYSTVRRPVHAADRWVLAPGGRFIAVLAQSPPNRSRSGRQMATLSVLSVVGDTLWSQRFTVDPVPLRADRAFEKHALRQAEFMSQSFGLPRGEVVEAYRAAVALPPQQVAFDRMVAGGDGEILLRRGSFGLEKAEWWRVMAEGVTAVFTLPADYDVVAAQGRRIYTLSRGAMDEPVLTLWTPRSGPLSGSSPLSALPGEPSAGCCRSLRRPATSRRRRRRIRSVDRPARRDEELKVEIQRAWDQNFQAYSGEEGLEAAEPGRFTVARCGAPGWHRVVRRGEICFITNRGSGSQGTCLDDLDPSNWTHTPRRAKAR